jgi:hypothetical protein
MYYFELHATVRSTTVTILLLLGGGVKGRVDRRGNTVHGIARVLCEFQKQQLWLEPRFWSICTTHNLIHTNTLSVELPWLSDQSFAQATTYTTHNTKQTNIHALSRIGNSDCRNQIAATHTLHCMTTGIGRYSFMWHNFFLIWKFWIQTNGNKY